MSEDAFEGIEPPGGVNYGEFSFRVKRWVLAGLADAAAAALPCTAAIPAMGCFRVRVAAGRIQLAATDMERTVLASSQAVAVEGAEDASHEVFIPARRLQSILRELPEVDVTIAVKKNQAVLRAGGEFLLMLPDSSGYPELGEYSQTDFRTYSREKFLAGLRAVRHVVSKDAGRPPLTQAEIRADPEDEGQVVVTASDGARFARARVEGCAPFAEPMCIPSSALDDLIRMLAGGEDDAAAVAMTEDELVFSVGPVTLAVKRRSTPFPDVDRLLLQPALEHDQPLSLDKDELAAAVRRVRINADGETSAIVLELGEGSALVVSRDKAGNAASEGVIAMWAGKERVLCVNHVFLAEMLAAHPDKTCQFKVGKDLGKRRSSIILQAEGVTQIMNQMVPSLVGY